MRQTHAICIFGRASFKHGVGKPLRCPKTEDWGAAGDVSPMPDDEQGKLVACVDSVGADAAWSP